MVKTPEDWQQHRGLAVVIVVVADWSRNRAGAGAGWVLVALVATQFYPPVLDLTHPLWPKRAKELV